jgi:hypothetical protein
MKMLREIADLLFPFLICGTILGCVYMLTHAAA